MSAIAFFVLHKFSAVGNTMKKMNGGCSLENIVYIKLKRRITITPLKVVQLKDLAELYCMDEKQLEKIKQTQVYIHKQEDGNRNVIEALDIIKKLKKLYPTLQIELVGEPHTLLIIEKIVNKKRPIVFIICWLILFFGSGLAIMNFHSDVNMYETQVRIVQLLTGRLIERPLWFQIPYSLGIGVGMLLFFNHSFKKRKNEEPNPLEVEMYLYQENVNSYVISDEMRKRRQS